MKIFPPQTKHGLEPNPNNYPVSGGSVVVWRAQLSHTGSIPTIFFFICSISILTGATAITRGARFFDSMLHLS